jgi:N-methylhydantoinase B
VVNYYGMDKRTGRFLMGSGGLGGGGWGATDSADGVSATVCINDGDTHNQPVEAMEAKYPAVADSYSLRTDSGGPGRFRGGLGTTRSLRLLTEAKINSFIERTKCAPWGVAGGDDALPNGIRVRSADGTERTFPNGKVDGLALAEGDSYVVETGGGGGFGDPRTRPAEAVLADVEAGYVTTAQAASAYGVAIIPGDAPRSLRIDEEATRTLRA